MTVFKKFVSWFIFFGLSFLVQSWGWTEQGKAFMYIHLGVGILYMLFIIGVIILAGLVDNFAVEATGFSVLFLLLVLAGMCISLFASWGASKLFDVDFYTAYMIMTFGQCLCSESNQKKE